MSELIDSKNKIIALIGAGMSLICFSMYLREVEKDSLESGQGTPIGTVVMSVEDVQRRPRQKLMWVPLPAEHNVYERDVIRTGPNAFTRIDLGKRGVIELKSDTLAVLETQNDSLRVNLASGDLFVKGDVLARVGDSEIQSKDGTFAISKDLKSGKLQVQTQSGKVAVVNNGQRTEVGAGNLLTEDGSGQIKVEQFPLQRSRPTDGEILKFRSDDQSVPFSVQIKDREKIDPGNLVLEVATEKTFRASRLISRPWPNLAQTISLPLKEGFFFWRVRDLTSKKVLSTVGSFEVQLPPRLKWRNANRQNLFTAQLSNEGVSLTLQWAPVRRAQSYQLRVLKPGPNRSEADPVPAGGEVVATLDQLSEPQVVWSRDKNSFWETLRSRTDIFGEPLRLELSALDSEHKSLTDAPLVARLQVQDDRKPATPLHFTAELVKDKPLEAQFKWGRVNDAKSYEVKLGESVVKTDQNSLSIESSKIYDASTKTPPALRAISKAGVPGDWKPVENFDLEAFSLAHLMAQAPQSLYPLPGSTLIRRDNREVVFEWKVTTNSRYAPESYELLIEPERTENLKPIKMNSKATRLRIPTPPNGRYAWKVRAFWPSAGPASYGASQILNITSGAALEAPRLRAPSSVEGDEP